MHHSAIHIQVGNQIPVFHCPHGGGEVSLKIIEPDDQPNSQNTYLTGTPGELRLFGERVMRLAEQVERGLYEEVPS